MVFNHATFLPVVPVGLITGITVPVAVILLVGVIAVCVCIKRSERIKRWRVHGREDPDHPEQIPLNRYNKQDIESSGTKKMMYSACCLLE